MIDLGGGGVDAISLKAARDWAQEARILLARGQNPQEVWEEHKKERKRTSQIPTFGEMIPQYLDSKAHWRSPKHKRQVTTLLTKDAKPLANKPVNEITTADVAGVLKPVQKRAQAMMHQLRTHIEGVMGSAQALVPGLADRRNPAQWKGNLDHLLPKRQKVQHHPAMPYSELPAFLTRLRALRWYPLFRHSEVAASSHMALPWLPIWCLEFCVLTATRSSEARGARWNEIDVERRLWTIPASRMKKDREHVVPLSDAAWDIVKTLAERSERYYEDPIAAMIRRYPNWFLFPGRGYDRPDTHHPSKRNDKPICANTLTNTLRRVEREYSVHGFRSSFRDWAGDKTEFPREVCEQALSHVIGSASEQAYRRGDALEKRKALMQAWSKYLGKPALALVAGSKARATETPLPRTKPRKLPPPHILSRLFKAD
jgi:integrase